LLPRKGEGKGKKALLEERGEKEEKISATLGVRDEEKPLLGGKSRLDLYYGREKKKGEESEFLEKGGVYTVRKVAEIEKKKNRRLSSESQRPRAFPPSKKKRAADRMGKGGGGKEIPLKKILFSRRSLSGNDRDLRGGRGLSLRDHILLHLGEGKRGGEECCRETFREKGKKNAVGGSFFNKRSRSEIPRKKYFKVHLFGGGR